MKERQTSIKEALDKFVGKNMYDQCAGNSNNYYQIAQFLLLLEIHIIPFVATVAQLCRNRDRFSETSSNCSKKIVISRSYVLVFFCNYWSPCNRIYRVTVLQFTRDRR